ncbi:hypothetical protein [Sphingobacterium siyangense]|uniref:hypothetical protein n=1 Tax=Sphingobacterium siyangense TaxID=459529 RepID=UPI002FDA7BEC
MVETLRIIEEVVVLAYQSTYCTKVIAEISNILGKELKNLPAVDTENAIVSFV